MKIRFKSLLMLVSALLLSVASFSQQYTQRDQTEIAYRAQLTLTLYKDLLNLISYADITQPEVKELIVNSYNDPQMQVFFSEDAIIEDDIKPSNLGNRLEQDKNVKDYLRYFDLAYAKSDQETVEFSDFEFSNLKYGEYIYIKVRYTSHFNGKHKEDTAAYRPVDRLAELRAEKRDNQWRTYITSIVYYDPEKPIDAAEGDLKLDTSVKDDGTFTSRLRELSGSASSLGELEKAAQASRFASSQDSLFRVYMLAGEEALLEGKYEEAINAYADAQQIKPYDLSSRRKILEVNQAILKNQKSLDNAYQEAYDNAVRAREVRDYISARNYLVEALRLKPYESGLKARISDLDKIIQNMAFLESKFNIGQYKEALKDYSKAIKEDKNNPDYYFGRARCYEKLEDTKNAIKDYSTAIQYDGRFIEALSRRANLYKQTSQPHKAIADYSLIISNPEYAASFYPERARVRASVNDVRGAIEDYEAAIALNPGIADYHYERGLLLHGLKELDLAVDAFSKAVGAEPVHTQAYYQRGLVYVDLEDPSSASIDFEKVRELGETAAQSATINNIAYRYFSTGEGNMAQADFGNAIGNYINALLISPSFGSAWLRKGDAHFMLQDYDNAILNYHKAIEFDSISFAYYRRGLAYQQIRDDSSASRDFKKYVPIGKLIVSRAEQKDAIQSTSAGYSSAQLNKENAEVFYALGYAQLMTKQFPDALESLDKAIKINKDYSQALFARGAARFALGDHKKAIKDMESSIKQGMSGPSVFYALGKAYEGAGKIKEAIKNFSQAISLDQNFETAYRHRAICYKTVEQYAKAYQDIQAVLSINESASNDVDLMVHKGLLELYQYKFEDADHTFDIALNINNDNVWALYGKACALANQSRFEESLELYRKAFQPKIIEWSTIKKDPFIKTVSKQKAFKELVKSYL